MLLEGEKTVALYELGPSFLKKSLAPLDTKN